MNRPIKIIDLFAGPGGLGEGFSAYQNRSDSKGFKIALSIEKEASAHQTLRLRAFYRQFPHGGAPKEYYDFLDGKLGKNPDEELFRVSKFKNQVAAANAEARMLTLGEDNSEIDRAIGQVLNGNQEPWVLIGGPPCQAYSLAGRSRNRGIKEYRIEEDHRSNLYKEYLRVIGKFSPAVFVMENVKGLLSAKHNGESIFEKIRADLANPGHALRGVKTDNPSETYIIFSLVQEKSKGDLFGDTENSQEFLIRPEDYGVPQARHRVILLGVRKDIGKNVTPGVLEKTKAPTLKAIIDDLPRLRSGLSKSQDSFSAWVSQIKGLAPTVIKGVRKAGHSEVATLMQVAVDRLGETSLERGINTGVLNRRRPKALDKWYTDPSGWKRVCNHETRGHIPSDLMRYLFCAAYSHAHKGKARRTPRAPDFPKILAPAHENWNSGKFVDRFRVQAADQVATTVTSHISKDGHYFIHYDPSQCRSLTVREAARIQTFPDNYFFLGSRTEQYVQVGNAVPSYLATQIASVVSDIIYPIARGA